ncbi:dethiobiotin synthase [Tremella mesenterica]|uniref:Dethiobiotin synthase n=1 Tax=Tremella mesenterica TaxID=5217 RepID=A0A4Q1BPW6_TREME|nr:dethiobiotin synthase [Tremella mesenterica]
MPLLFPNLRISQVFGANTDVGKTLLTTALLRATAAQYTNETETSSASGPSRKRVFYLKPVSTGPDEESDVNFVERYAAPYQDVVTTKNLYQYREPMSPHLAAQLAPELPFPSSNDELVDGVERYARTSQQRLGGKRGAMFIETAGGVHSPSLHPPHTQSTFLRALRLPSVLIASPHLGGISTTVSSYESLIIRGYTISAVLCLHHSYYRNHSFLRQYFQDRGIRFFTVRPPPKKHGTVLEDTVRLNQWYADVEQLSSEGESGGVIRDAALWLEEDHDARIQELEGMPERTLKTIWWPFTQHDLVNKREDVMVVDSAFQDNFDAYYAKAPVKSNDSMLNSYMDGSASWFTQSHGHAAEPLTIAAASAAGRYGHVLFPSGTNKPALDLAEKLVSTVGAGWAERVFYSDNGSTAVEVALKMALRASARRYGWTGELGGDVGIIGLRGGYHGDTIGAMDAAEASSYNTAVDWYKGRGHWFSPPTVQYIRGVPTIRSTSPDSWDPLPSSLAPASSTSDSWEIAFSDLQDVYNVSDRLTSPLATYYRNHIRSTLERLAGEGRRFGALILEPICLGAGGMAFVDPLFQACLVEVVRAKYSSESVSSKDRPSSEWCGLPVIYDEVFSGLNRFGYLAASSVLSHPPDISTYAKILTGGLLPLAATLASKSIFEAFLSSSKRDALLHGHSYTAHPVGCAVALRAIEMTEGMEWKTEKELWGVGGKDNVGRWSFWDKGFVMSLSGVKGVKGVMAMGTVLGIELDVADGGYTSHAALDFLTDLRKEIVFSPKGEFSSFQIHSRPLGNVVYLMTSLYTSPSVMRAMEEVLGKKFRERVTS